MNVTIEVQGVSELAARYRTTASRVRDITYSSANTTADRLKSRLARFVADEVRLPRNYVLGRINVKKASRKGNDAEATVTVDQDNILLQRYGGRPNTIEGARNSKGQKPVTVQVGTDSPRKPVQGGFLIRLRGSGTVAVATRERGSRRIRVRYGPGVDQIFRTALDDTPMLTEAEAFLYREIERRLTLELNGKRAGV